MKKIKIIFITMLFGRAIFLYGWDRTSVSALITNPTLFNGRIVQVEGELVGDIIEGRDGFWVNLLDSETAIGVWCPSAEKSKIRFLGRYKVQGDYVRVIGVFHRQCGQHAGDIDIHANSIDVLQQGYEVSEEIPLEKVFFAIFLGIVSLSAIGILQILSRRETHPHS